MFRICNILIVTTTATIPSRHTFAGMSDSNAWSPSQPIPRAPSSSHHQLPIPHRPSPAHQRPAFKSRPSLPSLNTLAKMHFVPGAGFGVKKVYFFSISTQKLN